jgi:hypothetical protein
MPCAMLRPWFRGGCHACFCRPDGWVPSVLVLCKHEVSPWLPKRTARSAPPSFSPPSRKLPPAAAQKFQTAYHLMFDCEQLQTPLLATTTALIERRSCGMVWVAWTEFGSVGVGRRTSVRQIDRKPHTPGHPGLDPVKRRHVSVTFLSNKPSAKTFSFEARRYFQRMS